MMLRLFVSICLGMSLILLGSQFVVGHYVTPGCVMVATDNCPRQSDASQKVKKVAYCDLFRHRERYEGKVIRTRAILLQGTGTSVDAGEPYLYDPKCNRQDAWSLIEYDPSYASDPGIEQRLNGLISQSASRSVGRALVVVRGRFDARNEKGYGHLDGFRARIVVQSIERVEAVQSGVPWPKEGKK